MSLFILFWPRVLTLSRTSHGMQVSMLVSLSYLVWKRSLWMATAVKRICVFEHSVMTNCNCACPAIQRGQGSGFLSEGSSWLTACMSEQRRFLRDCVDAQARLNLRCSHRRYVPNSPDAAQCDLWQDFSLCDLWLITFQSLWFVISDFNSLWHVTRHLSCPNPTSLPFLSVMFFSQIMNCFSSFISSSLSVELKWHFDWLKPQYSVQMSLYKLCMLYDHWQMSCDITKPTKWLCAQRTLRSALASAQPYQSLRCLHEESLGP